MPKGKSKAKKMKKGTFYWQGSYGKQQLFYYDGRGTSRVTDLLTRNEARAWLQGFRKASDYRPKTRAKVPAIGSRS